MLFSSVSELTPQEAEAIDESTKAFQELERSTDRVTAIVGGVILDNQMQKALSNRFVNDSTAREKFFEDSLEGTHAKIRLLYLLGVVKSSTRANLEAINSIRNRFAHRTHIRDFEHQQLTPFFEKITLWGNTPESQRFTELFLPEPLPSDASRRKRFIAAVTYLHLRFVLDPFVEKALPVEPHF